MKDTLTHHKTAQHRTGTIKFNHLITSNDNPTIKKLYRHLTSWQNFDTLSSRHDKITTTRTKPQITYTRMPNCKLSNHQTALDMFKHKLEEHSNNNKSCVKDKQTVMWSILWLVRHKKGKKSDATQERKKTKKIVNK